MQMHAYVLLTFVASAMLISTCNISKVRKGAFTLRTTSDAHGHMTSYMVVRRPTTTYMVVVIVRHSKILMQINAYK